MDATVHTPLGRKDTNNIAIFQMFKTKTHTDLTDPTDFTTTRIIINDNGGVIKDNSDNLDNIIHE
jgi:hypothetical protein